MLYAIMLVLDVIEPCYRQEPSSHVHQGQQPNPEQEHWEIQPPTYMG